MKSLALAAAVAAVGSFALSGCSSCSKPEVEAALPTPVTCGPGTVAQGNQCVATTPVK